MPHSNNNNKKVWALMHMTHEDMGSFEFILRSIGIRPVPMMAKNTDIEALDPAEADLVLIMGGPMGVYDAETHCHLHHEIRFAEQRIALGKPLLGVCLGAQIIAKALGANVYKGPRGKEVGWTEVTVTEDGLHTPVRYFDKTETRIAQWHQDTFDLPAGAKRLATNGKYENQAFGFESSTLALQFHPEVTELKLERWYTNSPQDIADVGTTVEDLRADAHKYGDGLKQQNRQFFTEWLSQVAPHLLEKHPRN